MGYFRWMSSYSVLLTRHAVMRRCLPSITPLILYLMLGGCTGMAGRDAADAVPLQIIVPVLYATNRNVSDASDPTKFYGGDRAEMSYGVATVAVSTKKLSDSRYADWTRWETPDSKPKNKNQLLSVDRVDRAEFDRYLAARVASTDDRAVLVYIHGFSKKFDTVAKNMAILTYAIDFQGVPVFFSWPSKGSVAAYSGDSMSLDWATPHLQTFLRELVTERDVNTVHVVAHSLGNRAFLEAFLNLLQDTNVSSDWKFGEIVLFAPDVDADIFVRDILPSLQDIDSRITLYVSAVDVALQASWKVNRYRRIGDAKAEILIEDGIETVDVTPVTTIFNGHSTHRDSAEIQSDLYYLINERLAADDRPTLVPVETEMGRYWAADEQYLAE